MTLLRLQRTVGNRAVRKLMRDPTAEERAYVAIMLLRTDHLDWRPAMSVLLGLQRLDDAALARVIRRVDGSDRGPACLDRLIREMPPFAFRNRTLSRLIVRVISKREPARNRGLAQRLLSYGAFDWSITDQEATVAGALLDALPETDRRRLYESWFGERLRTNLPGSADYERGVGEQLVSGGLMGDFEEDQSFWTALGQIGVGLVPYAGQVADVRDLVACLRRMANGGWRSGFEWLNLILTAIGFVPGLGDLVKSAGKGALRWLRVTGARMIGGFFDALRRHVVQPALDHLVRPLVRRIKATLTDRLARAQERIRRAFEPEAAARGTRQGIEAEADSALRDAVGAGRRAADDVVGRIARSVVDAITGLARTVFRRLKHFPDSDPGRPFTAFEPAIEGDYLVIYGRASRVRIAKVRYSEVLRYVVEKNAALLRNLRSRSARLAAARRAGDAATGALIRQGAIELTEEIGELIAENLIKIRFRGARRLYRGAGSGVLDLVYESGGELIVVEAKGGAGRLTFREIRPDVYARQGTLAYLDNIIANMIAKGGEHRRIALRLQNARERGRLQYFVSDTGPLSADRRRLNSRLRRVNIPARR